MLAQAQNLAPLVFFASAIFWNAPHFAHSEEPESRPVQVMSADADRGVQLRALPEESVPKSAKDAPPRENIWPTVVNPECGSNCLYAFLKLLNRKPSRAEVFSSVTLTGDGATLLELKNAAIKFGIPVEAVNGEAADILAQPLPLIAHMRTGAGTSQGHYVVVTAARDDLVRVVDGSTGQSHMLSPTAFARDFSGNALVIERGVKWQRWIAILVILTIAFQLWYLFVRRYVLQDLISSLRPNKGGS